MNNNTNFITIFTPTYNRGEELLNLYSSLIKQSRMDFEWLVIDDGSTDNTEEIVKSLIEKVPFKITYVYKENGGKHTAINMALEMVKTPLLATVDNDDYLAEDALEIIAEDFFSCKDETELCEFIYLRKYKDNAVIGEKFPVEGIVDPIENILNNRVKGDKFGVMITEKFIKYRFPVFNGEKFMGESVLSLQVYKDKYKVKLSNKAIYVCEYRADGLTAAGRKLRISNPLGGMEYANANLKIKNMKLKYKIKNVLLFVCYGLFAQKHLSDIFKEINCPGLGVLLFLPGAILYQYWKRKFLKA